MDSEKIAQTLIQLRGEKTRAEVASALGLSVSAVAMYENGERIPRDETKIKIAAYYGKSVEDIFSQFNVTKSDIKLREPMSPLAAGRKDAQMNEIKITPEGAVLLNGTEVKWCLGLDISSIDPANGMEVALRIAVDKLDANYKIKV